MLLLEHGKYYHIYNRGNNREDLFRSHENYNHFLRLYEKYIHPIADTFAWVLMKNHFHLLVRIKTEEEIGFYLPLNPDRSNDSVRFQTTGNNLTESEGPVSVISSNIPESEGSVRVRLCNINNSLSIKSIDAVRLSKRPDPTRHFSHLFNAYAKYYNPKHHRTGALFERSFERKEVDSLDYLRKLVVYIHTNPVHHGFTNDFTEYPWSSYQLIISSTPTKLKRDEVINWFNDIENLKYMHQMKIETELISDILLE